MPPVIAATKVGRAAGGVFAYATGPARFPHGKKEPPKATPVIPDPPKAGTRCLTTRRIGGAATGNKVALCPVYGQPG